MKLVLIRHGQSQWNLENRFTGWHDCELTEQGRKEAELGGKLIVEAELIPPVIYTSVLTRATQTTDIILATFKEINDNVNISVKKDWRLNERHYGDLTGKDKKQAVNDFGKEQVFAWRRKYSVRPPDITDKNEFAKGIADHHKELSKLPKAESLENVLTRLLPCFEDVIKPDLMKFQTVLVSAHGNSLRALIKHLDDFSEDEISQLNIPTAIPLVYELTPDFLPTKEMPITERYLGDPEAAEKAAAEVARQTKAND